MKKNGFLKSGIAFILAAMLVGSAEIGRAHV